MSSLTPEDLKAILAMQQQAQPAAGAISVQGINKYWPQIVGIVAVGWFLMGMGKDNQALQGRVANLEEASKSVAQVKAEQLKTTSEVAELKITVNSIQTGQVELAKRMESVGSDVRALSAQVSSISQALRGR